MTHFRLDLKTDYHIHSNCSDGTKTPEELVAMAAAAGYEEIALTDHDGTSGIERAAAAGRKAGIRVIKGVEVSSKISPEDAGFGFCEIGREIYMHILGYDIDPEYPPLKRMLDDMMANRIRRNLRIIDAINEVIGEKGFHLTWDDMGVDPHRDYIGRPNFARALVAIGAIDDFQDAFEKIFKHPVVKAVKKDKVDAIEAIRTMSRSGGTVVLAHPGLIKAFGEPYSDGFYEGLSRFVENVGGAGLSGIECYYPKHPLEERQRLVEFAAEHELLVSCGSDYHGKKDDRLWTMDMPYVESPDRDLE